jgi:hypothetical protein
MARKQNVRMVVEPSSITMAGATPLVRSAPRPLNQRQHSYSEEFDSTTLFYDVFQSDDRIVLSGPPLLNLKAALDRAEFTDDSGRVLPAHLEDMDRTQRSFLQSPQGSTFISILSDEFSISTSVGPDLREVFAGLNVLFTKSKDNHLIWIRDWAEFHVKHHGITGLLIYDNGSTAYSPEEVLQTVGSVDGLTSVVVVRWPFKFGPQGGGWDGLNDAPWDSDFCEYGIMEHARWRFLPSAKAVINADVDELVLANDRKSVFDVLDSSSAPVLRYPGRWIEKTSAVPGRVPRHSDFSTYDISRGNATAKWAARPADIPEVAQWKTHGVPGADTTETTDVMHRHFMAISSDWKRSRTGTRKFTPSNQRTDQALVDAVRHAFDLDSAEVDGPVAAESPMLVVPHKTLVALQGILEQDKTLGLHATKLWFYSTRCLVLDMEWSRRRVAIDMVLTDDDIVVKLHARDAVGQKLLERVVSQTGCLFRSGKYIVARVRLEAVPSATASALLRIINNLYVRGQEPDDNPAVGLVAEGLASN